MHIKAMLTTREKTQREREREREVDSLGQIYLKAALSLTNNHIEFKKKFAITFSLLYTSIQTRKCAHTPIHDIPTQNQEVG